MSTHNKLVSDQIQDNIATIASEGISSLFPSLLNLTELLLLLLQVSTRRLGHTVSWDLLFPVMQASLNV